MTESRALRDGCYELCKTKIEASVAMVFRVNWDASSCSAQEHNEDSSAFNCAVFVKSFVFS